MSTVNFTSLGKRLLEARDHLSITQSEVASRAGVTAPSVTNWENDKNFPSRVKLVKLAVALEVSVEYLTGETDDPTPLQRLPHSKSQGDVASSTGYDRVQFHAKKLMGKEFLESTEDLLNYLLRQDLKRIEKGNPPTIEDLAGDHQLQDLSDKGLVRFNSDTGEYETLDGRPWTEHFEFQMQPKPL